MVTVFKGGHNYKYGSNFESDSIILIKNASIRISVYIPYKTKENRS